jgi:hypothetical protein
MTSQAVEINPFVESRLEKNGNRSAEKRKARVQVEQQSVEVEVEELIRESRERRQ